MRTDPSANKLREHPISFRSSFCPTVSHQSRKLAECWQTRETWKTSGFHVKLSAASSCHQAVPVLPYPPQQYQTNDTAHIDRPRTRCDQARGYELFSPPCVIEISRRSHIPEVSTGASAKDIWPVCVLHKIACQINFPSSSGSPPPCCNPHQPHLAHIPEPRFVATGCRHPCH